MTENQNIKRNFSELEYLKSLWIKIHNKDVREHFKDEDEGEDAEFFKARPAIKYACLLKDNDAIPIMIFKTLFFYLILRKAQDLQVPVIGMPISQYEETTKYAPIVTLYFKQPSVDTGIYKTPLTAQISIRLVKETSETITMSELMKIAKKNKSRIYARR